MSYNEGSIVLDEEKRLTKDQSITMATHNVEQNPKHVVFVSTHFRSHFRPMFFAALSLVTRFHYLAFTIYVTEEIFSIVEEEWTLFESSEYGQQVDETRAAEAKGSAYTFSGVESTSLRDRVRVIKLTSSNKAEASLFRSTSWLQRFEEVYTQLPVCLQSLWNHSGVAEQGNGSHSNGLHASGEGDKDLFIFALTPSSIVVDILLDIPRIVKDLTNSLGNAFSSTKVLGFGQIPVAWALRRLVAPDIQKKLNQLETSLARDTKLVGRARDELIERILMKTDGSIVDVMGSHRCYDYELIPQYGSMDFNASNAYAVYKASHHMRQCQGIIFTNSPEFELDSAAHLQQELNKPVFQIGPQFPLHWWDPMHLISKGSIIQTSHATNRITNNSKGKVKNFLEQVYGTLGSKRVLYISFGSVYSMEKRPDLIETLIRVLLKVNQGPKGVILPFILTTLNIKSLFPVELRRQVEQRGFGLFCEFSPQLLVLQHPATGWFLTHGGSSSVHESIFNGVPLIFWPTTTDQPIAAAQLTLNLICGIELIQVRTGPSTGRPTLRGVQHHGGSLESIEAELFDTFALLTSTHESSDLHSKHKQRASEIRANVEKLAIDMRKSQINGGRCSTAVNKLATFL